MTIESFLNERDIKVHDMDLIKQAFIHSSYANEHHTDHDNERLEFMGDAVLQLWSSAHIYPLELSEGEMTTLRAKLVCEKALSEYAKTLKLNELLKLGAGEEKNGGRDKESIVADMFEAFLGALYLDCGMEAVDVILEEVLLPKLDTPDELDTIRDYKTKLQEYVQSDTRKTVYYELVSQSGPPNNPQFVMQVKMDSIILGTGTGNSKKKAEQAAARNAFEKMVR